MRGSYTNEFAENSQRYDATLQSLGDYLHVLMLRQLRIYKFWDKAVGE